MAHEDDLWGEINVSFNAYSLDGCRRSYFYIQDKLCIKVHVIYINFEVVCIEAVLKFCVFPI